MNEIASNFLLETLKSFKGMKSNTDKAIAQVSIEEMHFVPGPESNSIAILMQHIAGNMKSRFTDFLTTDGEKPGRNRDAEFIDQQASVAGLKDLWNEGWEVCLETLSQLRPEDLLKTVTIRNEPHTVIRALQRALVHYSYHCGQIVYICKYIRSGDFKSLSIPHGQSGQFKDRPPGINSNI